MRSRTAFASLFFLLCLTAAPAAAQLLHSPVNTGSGGGGTAWTTGYESLFINPANLYIREKEYRLQVALGTVSGYHSPPLHHSGIRNSLENFFDKSRPLNTPSAPAAGPAEWQELIERNFDPEDRRSEHLSGGEIHWFGLHWQGEERSYGVAMRSRYANRFVTGRGWYHLPSDIMPADPAGQPPIDRSLIHRFQSLHEFTFGYAESFTFLNGLRPRLSRFIIGIAPKIVASGSYLNLVRAENYRSGPDGGLLREGQLELWSSGMLAHRHRLLRQGSDPFATSRDRFDLFRPTGYGVGLDLGITWLVTLGRDLSVVRMGDPETRNSLRLAFSVTDIGFIRYRESPFHTASESAPEPVAWPPPSERIYRGMPGEELLFLGSGDDHPLLQGDESDRSFSVLLPTALQGGMLLQLNRIKLMGDMSLGLVDNAFNSTRLSTYIGAEVRPLLFLPLRAGIRFARNLPDYYSLGTGLVTNRFEIGAALQFRRASTGGTEIAGASVGVVKIYIP